MKERIIEQTMNLIAEMAESGEIEVNGEVNPETELYGEAGVLDSMGLVSLVLALEQSIESEFDATIALADEKALSQKNSPYRSVDTLASYAEQQIGETG